MRDSHWLRLLRLFGFATRQLRISAASIPSAPEITDPAEVGHSGGGRGDSFGDGGGAGESGRADTPQRAYVTGMLIALSGILMFFTGLVSAWIVRKGFPNSDWQQLAVPHILWLNTAILIASSFALFYSFRCFAANRGDEFRHWWGLAAALGCFFLVGQLIAWHQLRAAGIFLAMNPSISFFYVFTGAHLVHIVVGIAALSSVLFMRFRRMTLATAAKVAAMYWHFMCGIWIVLFLLLLAGK